MKTFASKLAVPMVIFFLIAIYFVNISVKSDKKGEMLVLKQNAEKEYIHKAVIASKEIKIYDRNAIIYCRNCNETDGIRMIDIIVPFEWIFQLVVGDTIYYTKTVINSELKENSLHTPIGFMNIKKMVEVSK